MVDSVAGRDGSTYVESVEVLRFLTGNTSTFLSYPPPASGAIEAGPGAKPLEDGPQTLPGAIHGKDWEDAFVLPALSDDQPLVLPGEAAFKFAGEPQVLPGADETLARPFLDLAARLAHAGDWTLPTDPDHGLTLGEPRRGDDWM